MANATKYSDLYYFQWSTKSAPNPTLSAPLAPTDTTIYFSAPPYDHTGTIITGGFLMGVKNSDSYVMTCYIAPGAVAADGLSATVVQGIDLEGTDFTVGDASLIPADGFSAGDAISCNVSGVIQALTQSALQGDIATGGTGFTIGTEPGAGGETITLYRTTTAGVKLGVLRWNLASGKVEFSNDGSSWNTIDSVSTSNLVVVSAADTTPGNLYDKITVGGGIVKAITSPAGDERLSLTADTAITYISREGVTIGKPVSKTTVTDEVELTTVKTLASVLGAETTIDAGNSLNMKSVYLTNNVVAEVYTVGTTSYVRGVAVTDAGVITPGAAQSLGANTGSCLGIVKVDSTHVAICYRLSSDNKIYAVGVTFVGSTAGAPGTAKEVGTCNSGTEGYAAIGLINTGVVVVAYRDTADSNKGKIAAATVAGNVIGNFDTAVEILTTGAGNAVTDLSVSYCSADRAVVFCENAATSKGKGAIVVAVGTTLSMITEVEISSVAVAGFDSKYISDGKVLATWVDASYCYARVANVAGLVLTYPYTATALNAAAATKPSCTVVSTTQAFVAYEESGASDGKMNELKLAGAGIEKGTQYTFNGSTNNVSDVSVSHINIRGTILVSYRDEADSNKLNGEVYQSYNNVDYCVGFAQSTVLTGASVLVRGTGLESNQSGLTTGSIYYITDGGISTTNSYGIKVGVAKDATELDISIERVGATTVPVIRTYTASSTWIKPIGLTYIEAEMLGAGGGGSNYASGAGAGGGSGRYAKFIVPAASLNAAETVTIGAFGAAEAAGGDSSFGSLVTCGGGGAASDETPGVAGSITTSITNLFSYAAAGNIVRSGSGTSFGDLIISGSGADTPYGQGGTTVVSENTGASGAAGGRDANGYGAGGGGANGAGTAGVGTQGLCVITEHF